MFLHVLRLTNCRLRAPQRMVNAKVKCLEQPLEILRPTLPFGVVHVHVPKNGKQLRKLNCKFWLIFAGFIADLDSGGYG